MTDEAARPERPLGSGYLLDNPLGSGAMGQVWRAHSRAGDPVAIKVLRTEFTADPTFVARFLQEAQLLKRVSSPNVVSVRDLVAEGSTLGIVMDLVDGPDLRRELTREGTFPAAAACHITDQVLVGLAAVHAASIVHRDVKPENVLVDRDPNGMALLRITDFGVARIVEQGPAARNTAVIGTPEYMAPELADGEQPSPQSDLYAVGIMLYELLSGVTPFAGGSPMAVMRRHVAQEAGRPAGIPDPLWALITTLIAKSPAARPASADAARARLLAVLPQVAALGKLPRLDAPPAPVAASAMTTVVSQPAATAVLPAVGSQPVGAGEPKPAGKDSKKRRWVIPVAAATALALLVGGFFIWRLTTQPDPSVAAPVIQPTETPSVEVPSASPSETPTPTPIEPAAPSVVGMQLESATVAIENAGFTVEVQESVNEEGADNTVLSQDPLAGQPVPDGTITLTVSRRSVGSYLADWDIVEESGADADVGKTDINGTAYAHAISGSLGSWNNTADWQYDLGRHYRRLTTTLGLSDSSNSGCKARFEILLDGRKVVSHDLKLGSDKQVEVDVTGALRLRFALTVLSDNTNCRASLGDPQVFGLPGEIPTDDEDEENS